METLKNAIIESMSELEFKSILELNDEVAELYEDGKITSASFYEILEELVEKLKK